MAGAINFWVAAREGESSEKRVARFKQWYNRARVATTVKAGRYRRRALTKRQERAAAMMREMYRAKREREKYYN